MGVLVWALERKVALVLWTWRVRVGVRGCVCGGTAGSGGGAPLAPDTHPQPPMLLTFVNRHVSTRVWSFMGVHKIGYAA